jgi:hypothetical protein
MRSEPEPFEGGADLQFIGNGERIARNDMEQSRSTGQVGCGLASRMRLCSLRWRPAESLLGPANGSLGLKPSGPLVFKHLVARFAIYEAEILEQCWG